MGIFSNIMHAIFGAGAQAAPAAGAAASDVASGAATGGIAGAAAAAGAAASAGKAAMANVDVAAILDKAVAAKGEKLDWRHSIVDLMKALNLDSSFAARKELAQELHYTGDTGDSASMNIWLHKQVMAKLAENGGQVPDDLKH